jgi:hypothetical protein
MAGEASLRASWNEQEARIECAVSDEEVPDMASGMAFDPDTVIVPDGERAKASLYADLRLAGSAEEISVESDNPNIEVEPSDSWEPVTANVARTTVAIVGHGKGQEGFVTARGGSVEAIAAVQVVSKKARPKDGGRFRGYKFQEIKNRKIQAMTDSEGSIIVNLLDPTNRLYFGTTAEEASSRVEQSGASQALLAELVLGECLQQAVHDAYDRGKLAQKLDEVSDIQNYIAEQRFEMGAEIYKLFVTK